MHILLIAFLEISRKNCIQIHLSNCFYRLLMCATSLYLNLRRTMSNEYVQRYEYQGDKKQYKKPNKHPNQEGAKEDISNKHNMLPPLHKQSTQSASLHLKLRRIQEPNSESSEVKQVRLKLQKAEQEYQVQCSQIKLIREQLSRCRNEFQKAIKSSDFVKADMWNQLQNGLIKSQQTLGKGKEVIQNKIQNLSEKLDILINQKRW